MRISEALNALNALNERHRPLKVSSLPVSDELTAACTAALLHTLVAKKVAMTRRAAQEFTGTCLLEAFGDGFTCFLHEKLGKEIENIAPLPSCKALNVKLAFFIRASPVINGTINGDPWLSEVLGCSAAPPQRAARAGDRDNPAPPANHQRGEKPPNSPAEQPSLITRNYPRLPVNEAICWLNPPPVTVSIRFCFRIWKIDTADREMQASFYPPDSFALICSGAELEVRYVRIQQVEPLRRF
jgi:hypothetical protein